MTLTDKELSSGDEPKTVRVDPPEAPIAEGDRYVVERVLGAGGMGTVFLVRDVLIGRRIALKRVNATGEGTDADDDATRRLRREARLQGQLEHPAIVPVYDVGSSADGAPFFTMKRVSGAPLSEILADSARAASGGFTRRRLLGAFSQLCLAVHYAHEKGVIHRDIKPANIMLGAYGEVYLLDWGVAKVEGEAAPNDEFPAEGAIAPKTEVNTAQGTIMGTPRTMAPEQAVGGAVDARTDVYALGAVLFELLTNEPLHPRGDIDDVLACIVRGIDARPSVRAPEADVPPELEEVCVRATKLDPGDRFASAKELHDAIEAYLDGDRDLVLRREGAKKHAARAKEIAEAKDESRRETALREVGRALALDPENKDALATLVALLTSPPKELPKEVVAAHDRHVKRLIRLGGVVSVVVYGTMLSSGLPILSYQPFWTVDQYFWLLALLAALGTALRPSYVTTLITYTSAITACVLLSTQQGPLVLVPVLITVHAVMFSFVRTWAIRAAVIAVAGVGWSFAILGDRLGLFPRLFEVVGTDLVVHQGALNMPIDVLTTFVWAAVLTILVAPAIGLGLLCSAWFRSDEAMRMQAWQLRRLVSGATASDG